ncbi:hypothetical protein H2199_003294 [Coniosporium tulheliwenetii]|uniref:Uncharacterized protein n=1 Tax=Coniosporium tulheliwenetii TaxID=3383036 RepID=A0ACC2ZD82_9PEZI|nr:hypothetical protein H2199_003294 [Cladosporium sp. JES 115]
MALPKETEASYAAIIDSILATSDLNTISAKRVRKGLQAQVDYDITPQKVCIRLDPCNTTIAKLTQLQDAITTLIHARFDKFNETHANGSKTKRRQNHHVQGLRGAAQRVLPSTPKKRSAAEEDDESELSSVADPSPPKKKAKKSKSASAEDADAAFAARLQAEENSRRRTTRGGE